MMTAVPEAVFINVPFDRRYKKLFRALIFTVHECGFLSRCALESDDGSEVRITKLYKIIGDCALGIHDLSRTTADRANRLPRFNMPLELGIYLGAKHFGDSVQQRKSALILERIVPALLGQRGGDYGAVARLLGRRILLKSSTDHCDAS